MMILTYWTNIRSRFLSGLGVVFLAAFLSYNDQFLGLNSSSGLEPAGRLFPLAFPRIYGEWQWFTHNHNRSGGDPDSDLQNLNEEETKLFWVEVDIICKAVNFLGILLSGIAAM